MSILKTLFRKPAPKKAAPGQPGLKYYRLHIDVDVVVARYPEETFTERVHEVISKEFDQLKATACSTMYVPTDRGIEVHFAPHGGGKQ
jgi:hypothetical protein